jgi:hypothetical protein
VHATARTALRFQYGDVMAQRAQLVRGTQAGDLANVRVTSFNLLIPNDRNLDPK